MVVTAGDIDMAARFKEIVNGKHLPCDALHVATITQEVSELPFGTYDVIVNIVLRFRLSSY